MRGPTWKKSWWQQLFAGSTLPVLVGAGLLGLLVAQPAWAQTEEDFINLDDRCWELFGGRPLPGGRAPGPEAHGVGPRPPARKPADVSRRL